jgi:hypothetical protein
MKLANFISDEITQKKEKQKSVISEPDPEEKDVEQPLSAHREQEILRDSLYNGIIKCQTDMETNGQFNV